MCHQFFQTKDVKKLIQAEINKMQPQSTTGTKLKDKIYNLNAQHIEHEIYATLKALT